MFKKRQIYSQFLNQEDIQVALEEAKCESFENQICSCNRILVADDEPFNIISIEGILERFDLTIDKAFDGQAVLDRLQEDMAKGCQCPPYQLLILDNTMPNKSGIQVAQEIRQG
mmetsp:Transcript_16867/g.16124  ORF Transcript_16867/g.16124 Transcript_16867/m.16124 type:complete len:114 (+) Transcript_16867:1899-2240(+)